MASVTDEWIPDKDHWILYQRLTLKHPLSIRSLYVLLVGPSAQAALRLSAELAGDDSSVTAALSLGVLGGTYILGDAEAKDRPAASSISTGMTEERDGLISDVGAWIGSADLGSSSAVIKNPILLKAWKVITWRWRLSWRSTHLLDCFGCRQDQPSGACL